MSKNPQKMNTYIKYTVTLVVVLAVSGALSCLYSV